LRRRIAIAVRAAIAYRRGVYGKRKSRAMNEADIAQVLELIEVEVRCGYRGEGEIIDEFRHRLEHWDGWAADHVAQFAMELERRLGEQRELEMTWTDVTPNDRLDRAFEQLLTLGIVAEQDAGATTSDGWSIVRELSEDYPGSWGATFFHRQDVERGVAGAGLLLAFGGFAEGDEHAPQSRKLALQVVEVLQQHGVAASWSGGLDERIAIAPFAWRRRRTTKPPA
jgi:uncharacterized protein DUF6891